MLFNLGIIRITLPIKMLALHLHCSYSENTILAKQDTVYQNRQHESA